MDDLIDDAYESKCSHPSPSFEAAGVVLATCVGKDELYFFDEGCGLTAQVELELKRKLHFANPTLSTSNEQDPFSGIKYLQTLMAKETSVDELELCLALEFCQFQTAYRKDAVNQLHPLVLGCVSDYSFIQICHRNELWLTCTWKHETRINWHSTMRFWVIQGRERRR